MWRWVANGAAFVIGWFADDINWFEVAENDCINDASCSAFLY